MVEALVVAEPHERDGGTGLWIGRPENEAIDALLEIVIASETRDALNLNTRALDRALRSLHIWVPQWYKDVHTVAYLDVYRHPENMPPYSLGDTDFWWYDAERAAELEAEGAF